MFRTVFAGICLFAMTACGSGTDQSTGTGTGGGGGVTGTVPDALAANLSEANYDASSNSLSLSVYGFDHPSLNGAYTRNAPLDIASADGTTTYQAFTYQENAQARQYLALFATGSTVYAGAVATEGEYGSAFGGTTYARISTYTRPTHGTAQYRGGYAGVIDFDPGGHDRGARVAGNVEIEVNFEEGTEGHIDGGITNRRIIDGVPAGFDPTLANLDLIDTALTSGEYFGDVRIGTQVVGNYGGMLGGSGATEIAGVIVITPYTSNSNIHEYGTFVLPSCATANASPTCP